MTAVRQAMALDGMNYLEIFVYLQVLDFITTLVGMRLGATEMTPFVRWLMSFHPVAGLGLAKLVGFGLGGLCLWMGRVRVIHWVNYCFAAIVLWNLGQIAFAVTR